MKTTIYAWVGSAEIDRFMHAADVFEPYKLLVDMNPIIYEVQNDLENVLLTLRTTPRLVCAAVWVPNTPHSWRDRTVWEVSNGHQACLLTKLLQHYGWTDVPEPLQLDSAEWYAERAKNENYAKQNLNSSSRPAQV